MIERFDDGNMAEVVKIGDVVRKQKSPWWNATRQILLHLESVDYPFSQRIISEDKDTSDFDYIKGETLLPNLDGHEGEETLTVLGQRIRELHDALEGFRLEPGTETVPWPVSPSTESIICHNDLSPWNTVMSDGDFQAFIDWDLVSYGTREWDLAWVCWRWAPIYPQGQRIRFDAATQARRCEILLRAYGIDALNLDDFVALIDLRMECGLESVEQLGAQGVPGFQQLLETGMHLSGHDDRAWLAAHTQTFRAVLESL